MIRRLVEASYAEHRDAPSDELLQFWLLESRTPDMLVELAARFPEVAHAATVRRPLVAEASTASRKSLRQASPKSRRPSVMQTGAIGNH